MMTSTGLAALADDDGRIAVLAMDQRATLKRMLDGAGRPTTQEELRSFKVDVVSALAPLSSGVLLDPEFGVPAVREAQALPPGVGLLVATEPVDKLTWNGEQRTSVDPERNAAWVRAQGGDAVKFLVYWNPDRPAASGEPDLAAEAFDAVRGVVEDCRKVDIPSVIEPLVSFGPTTQPTTQERYETVIHSATRLATLQPSLLKLEWPGSAHGCRRVSDALGQVPWALLSAGAGYEDFIERCRIALDNGASGIIAGRSIWKEAVHLDGEQRREFLRDTSVPRLAGLIDLLRQHGRSWQAVAES